MPDACDGELLRTFGETVRALRSRQGLSQEALAERAGLHRTYVGGIERGERNLALVNVCRVASALGTSMSGLFAEVEAATDR